MKFIVNHPSEFLITCYFDYIRLDSRVPLMSFCNMPVGLLGVHIFLFTQICSEETIPDTKILFYTLQKDRQSLM
jgi:hypothetical protein